MATSQRDAVLTLSACWIGCAVLAFALTAGILQVTRSDLDPVAMPLSAYLRGPGGVWLRSAYYGMASALAFLAWSSLRATRADLRSGLASVLFLVAALLLPVVAITVLYEYTPQQE